MRSRSTSPVAVAFAVIVAASVCVLSVVGCAPPRPRTEVMVVFEADRAVARVARNLQIEVFGGTPGTDVPSEPVQLLDLPLEDIGGFPVSHALVPRDEDETRLFRIEGRVFDENGDGPIGSVRAISGYVEGQTLVLRLRFYARCLYLDPCEALDESCGPLGDCEPARTDPMMLPSLDGGVPDGGTELCTNDIDCDDGVFCTRDACLEGSCLNVPEDTACTALAAGTCDAVNGCQYGAACDETSCVPGPCESSASCNAAGACVRTSACALGQVCCGSSCVIAGCNDGNPCTLDGCDLAAGRCASDSGDSVCNDGDYCNGTDFCIDGACTGHDGDPCTAPSRCDAATQRCVGCVADSDCPDDSSIMGMCVPLSLATCGGAGNASVTTTMWRCESNTCRASTSTGMTSCTAPPAPDDTFCRADMTTWSGTCEPQFGTCTAGGVERGMTTVYACTGGTCQSRGAGPTSRSCTYTPPSSCFGMDGGVAMDSSVSMDAGSDACVALPREDCSNGVDDDCDGYVDCLDSFCFSSPACMGGDACVGTVEDCMNGIDDDCDSMVDCADLGDCAADPVCFPFDDAGMGCLTVEICDNGIDDDCNGETDCMDTTCFGDPFCLLIDDAGT